MTNRDYETASVTAAQVFDRFEGQHKLAQYDAAIKSTEETLRRLQEERREIINRYDLNKHEPAAVCKRKGRWAGKGFQPQNLARGFEVETVTEPAAVKCPFCKYVIDEVDIADAECSFCGAEL